MNIIRRNYPRIPLQASAVTIHVVESVVPDVRCVNLSMGGMCVACMKHFREQCGLVELVYESLDEVIAFQGEFMVRWMKKNNSNEKVRFYGLQFTYYDVDNLNKLARIIVEEMKKTECAVAP